MAKKKVKQYRFRVPAELAPGVYRPGAGLFKPGSVIKLPDRYTALLERKSPPVIERWNPKLEPLDQDAYEVLKSQHPKARIKQPPKPAEDQLEFDEEEVETQAQKAE